VRSVVHEAKDDEKAGPGKQADDDKEAPKRDVTVWTGVDDYGVSFQVGETYLPYLEFLQKGGVAC
jgi:hypothetical protein